MSRSYKKNPVYTDSTKGRKTQKRWANKKIRRYKKYISNGNFYRKIFESYEIHDFIIRRTWSEEINKFNVNISSLKDERNYWEKKFYRK